VVEGLTDTCGKVLAMDFVSGFVDDDFEACVAAKYDTVLRASDSENVSFRLLCVGTLNTFCAVFWRMALTTYGAGRSVSSGSATYSSRSLIGMPVVSRKYSSWM
jgi:hypothetical protein